jgi:nicotinate-nucleotide adenylyltransferase
LGSDLKIGFFGGTFDPIHFGHLNLMIELKERCSLDRILICPAYQSPTKGDSPPLASALDRLKMTQLIADDFEWAQVLDLELLSAGPSYTVETLKKLISMGKIEGSLYLLLAEDAAASMQKWKDTQALFELAEPLIGTRCGISAKEWGDMPPFIKSRVKRGQIQISPMDISSTRIRERLKKGAYCGHLVPGKVLDYIYQHCLY